LIAQSTSEELQRTLPDLNMKIRQKASKDWPTREGLIASKVLQNFKFDKFHEYLTNCETTSRHAYWDQEKLFNEEKIRVKNPFDCPFNNETLYFQF
jgi:hypothetical protein